ncbi:MAG TPA: LysR family transcriptional regulator [Noviherbaspirillum sp.]
MNLSRVDLNLFIVFEAIFTLGSITSAGRRLNLSQSAVSHALSRLRTLFDDPLFERTSKGMTPTPLARLLIADVRNALQSMECTLQKTAHFDLSTTQRRFTIAMGDPFDSLMLPSLMARIGPVAPGLEVESIYSDRRRVEAALLDGSLDMAIDVLISTSPDIGHAPVLSEPLVVLAREGHPAIEGSIDLDTYLRQDHIQVSSRRRGLSLEDISLRRAGLNRHVRVRCQHYAAASRIVSQTNMLMTMPRSFALMTNDTLRNQILPVPFNSLRLELFLYWHARSENDAAARWLRDQILASVPAAPAQA